MLVISNRFQGKEALALYRMRWGIERLFVHLKRKGFGLEATHMTDGAKLEKLFGIVAIAFLVSFAWGSHLRATGQKSSTSAKRKSLFRLGLEDVLRFFGRDDIGVQISAEFNGLKALATVSDSLLRGYSRQGRTKVKMMTERAHNQR